MNVKNGNFKCPMCGNNEINEFRRWISQDQFINNQLRTKWIFYKDTEKKWKCCLVCNVGEDEDDDDDDDGTCRRRCEDTLLCCCCCSKDREPVFCLFYPCMVIFYILIFFWVDFIYYLCCASKKYIGVSNLKKKIDKGKEKELFDKYKGETEEEWNYIYDKWECSKCKYNSHTFLSFIKGSKTNNNSSNEKENSYKQLEDKDENDNQNYKDYEEYKDNTYKAISYNKKKKDNKKDDVNITISFCSSDQKSNIIILCKKTDLFNSIEKKLYNKCPEIEDKISYFLANGTQVNRELSLEKNKIKNGDKILYIYEE